MEFFAVSFAGIGLLLVGVAFESISHAIRPMAFREQGKAFIPA